MGNPSKTTAKYLERCLQVMSYEMLYEIFRRLPKEKLIKISRFCSRFRDVAGDRRFWKNVHIKYESKDGILNFEDVYSEPWPVKEIDLKHKNINPPSVSSDIGHRVKVTSLDLTSIEANEVTMKAILAKYQCTQLKLNYNIDCSKCHILGIPPEVFLKQTALEVLSLKCILIHRYLDRYLSDEDREPVIKSPSLFLSWLAPVVSNCKNLKTLDLSYNCLTFHDMLSFVRNLPASLEKLCLPLSPTKIIVPNTNHWKNHPIESFFKLLAESTPNLRDLKLCRESVTCPSLLKFQFLETLRFESVGFLSDINNNLFKDLIKFPALKTIYCDHNDNYDLHGTFRTTLELHGISVKPSELFKKSYPEDENVWKVMGCKTKKRKRE